MIENPIITMIAGNNKSFGGWIIGTDLTKLAFYLGDVPRALSMLTEYSTRTPNPTGLEVTTLNGDRIILSLASGGGTLKFTSGQTEIIAYNNGYVIPAGNTVRPASGEITAIKLFNAETPDITQNFTLGEKQALLNVLFGTSGSTPYGTKTITKNAEYDVRDYAYASVDVPNPILVTDSTLPQVANDSYYLNKFISYNGEIYKVVPHGTAAAENLGDALDANWFLPYVNTGDATALKGDVLSGKTFYNEFSRKDTGTMPDKTALKELEINAPDSVYVPMGYYPSNNTQIKLKLQDKTASANGEITADVGYAGLGKVTVNVADEPAVLQEKNVNPTASVQVIMPDTGYDGLSKVTVGAIETEALEVTAGTEDITGNAPQDKYYSQYTVHPTPTEEKTVTVNGEVTPSPGKFLSKVIVNVPDENPFIAPNTMTMNNYLTEKAVGSIVKYTGDSTSVYDKNALYLINEEINDLQGTWVLKDNPVYTGNSEWALNFSSNNDDFLMFSLSNGTGENQNTTYIRYTYATSPDSIYVYSGAWAESAYKTIVISSQLANVTNGDSLLAWLQENATKTA